MCSLVLKDGRSVLVVNNFPKGNGVGDTRKLMIFQTLGAHYDKVRPQMMEYPVNKMSSTS